MNYAAKISYIGKNYSGWQIQPDVLSVQEVLENVLEKLESKSVKTIGAGRTDKGVNAYGQVVSFKLEKIWNIDKLRLAINFYLPDDIRVMKIFNVDEDFNARRSALSREYKYFIYHGPVCPPFLNNFVWWRKGNKKWDFDIAKEACKILEGKHDFRAFCRASECPDDSFRTLDSVKIKNHHNFSIISVRAQSFLTNMVRIIVGNINSVAIKKENLEWLKNLLTGTERSSSAMTVPACGLWFWRVKY